MLQRLNFQENTRKKQEVLLVDKLRVQTDKLAAMEF